MKIRRLPEIDLANFAPLSPKEKRQSLQTFNAGKPLISYRPARLLWPDVFNAQYDLFGTAEPTSLAQIERRIRIIAVTPEEAAANIEVASSMHAFALEEGIRAKFHEIPPFVLAGAVGIELRYWVPLVAIMRDQLVVPFIDPRRSHGLTREGRRFVFSMMNQQARVLDPDLADAELAIFQLPCVSDGKRQLRPFLARDMLLYSYDELDAMVSELYKIWQEVSAEREQEVRRKAPGRRGDLL